MKNIAILLLIFSSSALYAQQDPLYAQYINNPLLVNPGYTGFHKSLNISGGYRQQWSGYDGPKTINFSADIALRDNRMGTGILLVSDQTGASTTTDLLFTYAYKIPLNHNTQLSFGMQAGAINSSIDNGKLNVFDTNDPLFQGKENSWVPNAGVGVILNNHRYLIGLAVPRMLKATERLRNTEYILYSRHYYFMASYLYPISENLTFKPFVLMRYIKSAPLSTDIHASVIINNKFQGGVFTRNFETYGMSLNLLMNSRYRLGYVIEIPVTTSIESKFLTHEVMLGIRLNTLSNHDLLSAIGF